MEKQIENDRLEKELAELEHEKLRLERERLEELVKETLEAGSEEKVDSKSHREDTQTQHTEKDKEDVGDKKGDTKEEELKMAAVGVEDSVATGVALAAHQSASEESSEDKQQEKEREVIFPFFIFLYHSNLTLAKEPIPTPQQVWYDKFLVFRFKKEFKELSETETLVYSQYFLLLSFFLFKCKF